MNRLVDLSTLVDIRAQRVNKDIHSFNFPLIYNPSSHILVLIGQGSIFSNLLFRESWGLLVLPWQNAGVLGILT